MATRPVFIVKEQPPFFEAVRIDFVWNKGLADSQRRKNIQAIHQGFASRMPGKRVLEISSKSMQEGGKELSAFFLPKYVPELGTSVPVECVFQSGKVFQNGGPYQDLLYGSSMDAKRDPRLKNSGKLVQFVFNHQEFPSNPRTIFYDYIYINALLENENLANILLQYDGFTDIAFNPEVSVNCQAKSAATFVALSRLGLIDQARDFKTFLEVYQTHQPKPPAQKLQTSGLPSREEEIPAEKIEPVLVKEGDVVKHPKFGDGNIKAVMGTNLLVSFPSVGEKVLALKWCLGHCEVVAGSE